MTKKNAQVTALLVFVGIVILVVAGSYFGFFAKQSVLGGNEKIELPCDTQLECVEFINKNAPDEKTRSYFVNNVKCSGNVCTVEVPSE